LEHVGSLCHLVTRGLSANLLTLQATYKAYRDEDTGEPAPVTLVVGDLSMLFFAGESGALLERSPDHSHHKPQPGTETTATALVYVIYLLAARQEMWETLRSETSTVDLQAVDLLDTLRGLPYLNAFIRVQLIRAVSQTCSFEPSRKFSGCTGRVPPTLNDLFPWEERHWKVTSFRQEQ